MQIKMTSERILQGEECEFSGTVTVDVPSFTERQKFSLSIGITDYKPATEGTEEEKKIKNGVMMSEIASRASETVLAKVKACDLKHKDGQTHLTTAEEFACHPDANPLVENLVSMFINNFATKKTKPSSSSN